MPGSALEEEQLDEQAAPLLERLWQISVVGGEHRLYGRRAHRAGSTRVTTPVTSPAKLGAPSLRSMTEWTQTASSVAATL